MQQPISVVGKSIPIRCLIETVGVEQVACGGSKEIEKESFAIVPSSSLFKDVVKTVLLKLGYSSQDVANAKGQYCSSLAYLPLGLASYHPNISACAVQAMA